MSINLNEYQLLPIFAVSLVAILAASEIGRRVGVRIGRRGGENVPTLVQFLAYWR